LIWLDDTAVAVRFVGAAGVGLGVAVGLGVGVGVGVVVAVAVGVGLGVDVAQRLVVSAFAAFEYSEFPTLLYARTRKYLSPENLRLLT
jgi:hypothetical protein